MSFAVPRIWREPRSTIMTQVLQYSCIVDVSLYRKDQGRQALQYPSIPSSLAPVPHGEGLPVPDPQVKTMWASKASEPRKDDMEKDASRAFGVVMTGFLGNRRTTYS